MAQRASRPLSTARSFSLASMVVALLAGGCAGTRPAASVPAPAVDIGVGTPVEAPVEASTSEPLVAYDGEHFENAFYAPASLASRDGCVDLLVHFHGAPRVAVRALEESKLGAALVNVNLGTGSTRYREAFAADGSLDHLVDFAVRELRFSGRLPDACIGRIGISAWSAGYAAAREILERPADAARINALVLVDGFFTDWQDRRKRTVDLAGLSAAIELGRQALDGERFFLLTHTAIDRRSYAGADVAAHVLLRALEVEEGPPRPIPRAAGGRCTYSADAGDLHVIGFSGKRWQDHVDQHRAMGAVHYAELRRYWHPESAAR